MLATATLVLTVTLAPPGDETRALRFVCRRAA